MSAPEPRANPNLRGQEAAEAALSEAMRSGRLHHAWLIIGESGVGKATLAFRFARRLLAGPAADGSLALPQSHPVFHRVAAATHADLLTVEREWDEKRRRMRGEIVAETARGISDFLSLTPAEGGWRVVVLDGAEDLNRHAANALLKVLEEPPPRAVLLLVCSAAGRLLPTIRSRCRRLVLPKLEEADLLALLAEYLPESDEATRRQLAKLAEGSIGRALTLAAGDGVAYARLVAEVLSELPVSVTRAHQIADAVAKADGGFSTFMELLRAALAAAVRAAAAGRADALQEKLLGVRTLDAWVDVWHALSALQDETENLYLDKRQAIVSGLRLLAQ